MGTFRKRGEPQKEEAQKKRFEKGKTNVKFREF